MKAVYTIDILDFVFDEDKDDDKFFYDVRLTEQETQNVFSDKLVFLYLEMPKFNKTEKELETHFDKWMFAIKNLSKLEKIPGTLHEDIFERFFEIAEIAQMDNDERSTYENSLQYYRDMNNVVATTKGEGWAEGKAEGEEIGLKKNSLNVANKCIQMGMSCEDISNKRIFSAYIKWMGQILTVDD